MGIESALLMLFVVGPITITIVVKMTSRMKRKRLRRLFRISTVVVWYLPYMFLGHPLFIVPIWNMILLGPGEFIPVDSPMLEYFLYILYWIGTITVIELFFTVRDFVKGRQPQESTNDNRS